MDKTSKILGCILGGAIGDCLGNIYEGQNRFVDFNYQYDWKTSDDTQMTLATCEAISKTGQILPKTIAETFKEWFLAFRFTGLGASTYKALSELTQGGHWALVGRKGEMAAGNGTAMRIAPLAFCINLQKQESRVVIRDVCRITHHHEEAYVGALAVLLSVEAVMNNQLDFLDYVSKQLPDSQVRDRLIEINRAGEKKSISKIATQYGCSGYIVESVPFALYAVQQIRSDPFQKVLEEVISAGGDTDTNASIVGQIAGTYLGYEKLPLNLINRLPDLEQMMSISNRFAESVKNFIE